jgi:hypothetical protein
LDILVPGAAAAEIPSANPGSLIELFSTTMSDTNPSEDACTRFTRGLRGLIGARDVLVRSTPMVPGHDCESILFRLNGDDRSGMILQVLFDRNRSLTTAEFRLLKAATGLASALLELEGISVDQARSRTQQLVQVA